MSGRYVQHLQGGNIVVACFATGRRRLHTYGRWLYVEVVSSGDVTVWVPCSNSSMRSLRSPCSCSHQTLLRKRKKVKSGIQSRLGPLPSAPQCIWEPWHPLAVGTHKLEARTLIHMILLDNLSPLNNASCIGRKTNLNNLTQGQVSCERSPVLVEEAPRLSPPRLNWTVKSLQLQAVSWQTGLRCCSFLPV